MDLPPANSLLRVTLNLASILQPAAGLRLPLRHALRAGLRELGRAVWWTDALLGHIVYGALLSFYSLAGP